MAAPIDTYSVHLPGAEPTVKSATPPDVKKEAAQAAVADAKSSIKEAQAEIKDKMTELDSLQQDISDQDKSSVFGVKLDETVTGPHTTKGNPGSTSDMGAKATAVAGSITQIVKDLEQRVTSAVDYAKESIMPTPHTSGNATLANEVLADKNATADDLVSDVSKQATDASSAALAAARHQQEQAQADGADLKTKLG